VDRAGTRLPGPDVSTCLFLPRTLGAIRGHCQDENARWPDVSTTLSGQPGEDAARAANGREHRNCLEPNVWGLMRNVIDHQANWMQNCGYPSSITPAIYSWLNGWRRDELPSWAKSRASSRLRASFSWEQSSPCPASGCAFPCGRQCHPGFR
jgi:hypothetical protein